MQRTAIDWATHSWNPVTGCYTGCAYCYARTIAHRFAPGNVVSMTPKDACGVGSHEHDTVSQSSVS